MQGGYFKTKRVHIFVNGRDQYKAFNIHPRCRLGWNAILDCFSKTLKPYFGAIRVLRTKDGRKIIENFDDLQHEEKYVACGIESFRCIKGGYRTNSEVHVKIKPTEYYPTEMLSLDDQKKYPCLIETMRRGRTLIYVFANGKKAFPKKVVLIKSDYKAWDSILTHIGNILDIPEGVRGLYTVFGQPLCSPYEIQHGGYYVAIPFNSAFKQIKYLSARRTKRYRCEWKIQLGQVSAGWRSSSRATHDSLFGLVTGENDFIKCEKEVVGTDESLIRTKPVCQSSFSHSLKSFRINCSFDADLFSYDH